MCVCERYMLKIKYLLQIYNKTIVRTNQGNNTKTQQYRLETRTDKIYKYTKEKRAIRGRN